MTEAQRKSGGTERYASSPRPLGDVLESESPVVERVVQLTRGLSADARFEEKTLALSGFFTDATFFDVFGFQLRSGNPATALQEPNALILTPETAARMFGERDPMGATVTFDGLADFVVTGVLAMQPGKTHIVFDVLGSAATLPILEKEERIRPRLSNWNDYYSSYNYVRVVAGNKAEALRPFLATIPERFYGDLKLESRDQGYSFELQPLVEITPGPILSNNLGRGMPQIMLIFLGVLAALGMLAALFNYTNLTLARSLTRAREVGIRKVTGASRPQLFLQFVGESILTAVLSLVGAETLLRLLLIPGFQMLQFTTFLEIDFSLKSDVYLTFIGFGVLIGAFAGLLPALIISAFRPTQVLKDVSKLRVLSRITLRKALIVFQFTLSLILFILITTMYKQISYALRMDYGFAYDNTLTIDLQGNSYDLVSAQMAEHHEVVGHAASSHNMGTWEDSAVDVRKSWDDEAVGVRDYSVDSRFLDHFDLALVAGKNFQAGSPTSQNSVLINERFVERFEFGSSHDAVGQSIIIGDSTVVQVAGVLEDFLYKPLVYELEPLLLRCAPEDWNVLYLRLQGRDAAAALASFERVWKTIDPVHTFSFRFYDELFQQVYSSHRDMMLAVGYLAMLAFAISILGLFGIASFNVESRIKETGIRKVCGANIRNLVMVLSRAEIGLLLVATAIAIPAGLFLSSMLLQTFAYRIDLGFGVLMPGLLAVLVFGGLTVGSQAAKAALANPIDSLRYE